MIIFNVHLITIDHHKGNTFVSASSHNNTSAVKNSNQIHIFAYVQVVYCVQSSSDDFTTRNT